MRDWYTRLVSSVLFPLHERIKGHDTLAVRRDLEETQWLSYGEIRSLQLNRLREFLCHVGTHVPVYKKIFADLGFSPKKLSTLEDLQQLPLTDKSFIRNNFEALQADDARGLARFNTGGSSGEPLVFLIGKRRVSHDVAAKWRATRWWGVDLGDPEIVVWGSPIELGAQDRIRQIRDRLFRTRLLPAFEMSEQKLDDFISVIRRTRPRMLFGYPSALSHIATHAQKRGVEMNDLGIRVAFVTSERLYVHQQNKISQVFGCPVANGYGGRDAGFIAHACPEGGMHITAEDIIMEVVDRKGRVLPPGESGEIVVTHLATGDFPFIRYRTGDVGIMDENACACGRGLPLLKEIQGRTTDFVVARDGTVLHGLALIYVLRDLPGIAEFKIIQESLDLIRVKIVREAGYGKSSEKEILEVFRKRLGEELKVIFEYPDHIEAEKSGKFRYVVSKVSV